MSYEKKESEKKSPCEAHNPSLFAIRDWGSNLNPGLKFFKDRMGYVSEVRTPVELTWGVSKIRVASTTFGPLTSLWQRDESSVHTRRWIHRKTCLRLKRLQVLHPPTHVNISGLMLPDPFMHVWRETFFPKTRLNIWQNTSSSASWTGRTKQHGTGSMI